MITRAGRSLPSRVAASLLGVLGMPELVARTPAEYEELAVRLATDESELARLRGVLDGLRRTSSHWQPRSLAGHLETAFARMVGIARGGATPKPFDLPPAQ